jgi:hypothetical protein
VYLRVNPKIFDTDEKKVLYALGLMTKGSAQCWAEDFYVAAESATITSAVTGLTVIKADYGKWEDFVTAFMQAFSPVDTKGAAMNKLSTWKMRAGTPASTHIATMNNYISCAEITDFKTKKTFLIQSLDNDLVTGLFNSGLANAATYADLTQNILAQENNMNTLKAIQHRNNNRRTQNNFTQKTPMPWMSIPRTFALSISLIRKETSSRRKEDVSIAEREDTWLRPVPSPSKPLSDLLRSKNFLMKKK